MSLLRNCEPLSIYTIIVVLLTGGRVFSVDCVALQSFTISLIKLIIKNIIPPFNVIIVV